MPIKNVLKAACLGTALVLGGFATQVTSSAPAMAQAHPPESPIILTPTTNTAVANPVNIAFELSPPPPQTSSGHSWVPHAFLVIDAPLPALGSTVVADAQHMEFPKGQEQLSLNLAPGQHQLQVVLVNREGVVTKRFQPGAPVVISVH